MPRRRRTHKGPVNSTKIVVDGVKFASKLEAYCYKRLKEEGLYEGYESEKFTLIDSFSLSNESYERTANGKGEFKNRGGEGSRKILGISYTPDFTGRDYIIETKGRANETFPIRWKLFKRWLYLNNDTRTLYKPQTQREVNEVIELILKKRQNG